MCQDLIWRLFREDFLKRNFLFYNIRYDILFVPKTNHTSMNGNDPLVFMAMRWIYHERSMLMKLPLFLTSAILASLPVLRLSKGVGYLSFSRKSKELCLKSLNDTQIGV